MQQKHTSCNRTIELTKPWLHYTVLDKDDNKHVDKRIYICVMYMLCICYVYVMYMLCICYEYVIYMLCICYAYVMYIIVTLSF